jgi:arylsulfatase
VASLLTSRYRSYHGVTQEANSRLASNAATVATALHSSGYATAAFVSSPVLDLFRWFQQGFDVYDSRLTVDPVRGRERHAEATTDAVLAWARVSARPPWFLWVHFQDPHGPYDPPETDPARDAPGDAALEILATQSGRGGIPAYQALPGLFTAAAYERNYIAEIRYLDAHVKRLVDGLDALGNAPGVWLTADHGEAFGEDGFFFAHGHSVALDQIRVPLLWRPPRPGTGTVVERPVSLIDVAPTLLRLAGGDVPASFQGRSLPIAGLASEAPAIRRPIFSENRHGAAVVVGRTYYARERDGEARPDWITRRSAQLPTDGHLPAYQGAANSDRRSPHVAALSQFLSLTQRLPGGARNDEVPAEVKENLRALGYTE